MTPNNISENSLNNCNKLTNSPLDVYGTVNEIAQPSTKLDFENIINTVKCGILIINYTTSFSMEYANDYFYELIGYTKNEYHNLFNDNIIARVYPDDIQKLKANVSRQLSMGGIIRFEFRIIKKDGSIAWILLNGTKHYTDSIRIHASFTDITEMKLLYNDIAEKNLELDTIYNNITGGLIKITLTDMRVIYANDGFYDLIGYTKEEFLHIYNNICIDIIYHEDINSLFDIIEKGMHDAQINFRLQHKDGVLRWACLNASRIGSSDGKPVYLCTILDVTKSKTYEQKLELQQKKQHILTKLSGEWIWEYDILENKLVRTSSTYSIFDDSRIVYNYRESTLQKNIVHLDDICIFNEFCNNLESGRENFETEMRMRNKNTGTFSWYKLVATTLYDNDGDALCVIGKTINMDATHDAIMILQDKITKDCLTKSYNRITAQRIIESKLTTSELLPYALLLVDVDNFRAINQSLGRLFGDSLLIEVSIILHTHFPEYIIGRMGTDVFAVFLTNIDNKNFIEDKINDITEDFSKIYVGDNENYTITCSFGISYIPTLESNFEVLFRKADVALFSAKSKGKNMHVFYDPSLGYNSDTHMLNLYNMENSLTSLQESIDTALLTNAIDLLFSAADTISSIKILLSKMCDYFNCEYVSVVSLKLTKSGNYVQKDIWVPSSFRNTKKKTNCPNSTVEQHLSLFNTDNLFYCSDLSTIKNLAPEVYDLLSSNNTMSLLQCANYSNDEFKGYITLGNCSEKHSWSVSEVRTFSMVCKVIFSTIVKLPIK